MDKKKSWHDYIAVANLGALIIGGTWVLAMDHTASQVNATQTAYLTKRVDEIFIILERHDAKLDKLYEMQKISYKDEGKNKVAYWGLEKKAGEYFA